MIKKWMVAGLLMGAFSGVSQAAYFSYDLDPDVDIDDPAAYTYDPLTGTGAFGFGAFGIVIIPGDRALDPEGGWEVLTSGGSLLSIAEGATIEDGSGTWTTGMRGDLWTYQTNYYGIRYDGGSGYGYGWIKIWHDGDEANRDVQLLASGFNDSGTITAGETSAPLAPGSIPEPGTMALMVLGLGGAGLARRRLLGGAVDGAAASSQPLAKALDGEVSRSVQSDIYG